MLWEDICRSEQYRGRWVALDNVRYHPTTTQPMEAEVVDVDEDIADLCARMRESSKTSCAIVFCDQEASFTHRPMRLSQVPPRAAQH
jgi:hypothetical protein